MQQLTSIAQLVSSLGLGALVVLGYFALLRYYRERFSGVVISGVLFGCGAVLAMLNPIQVSPGVFFDARSVFLALASPFAGPISGLIALAMAVTARFSFGGSGAFAGSIGLVIACAAGMLLWYFGPRRYRLKHFLILAAMASMMVFSAFAMGVAAGFAIIAAALIPLITINFLGVVLLGLCLEAARSNNEYMRIMAFEAERDPLTHLFNRRILDDVELKLERSITRDARQICVILFDIDHFKAINDQFGHARGDDVLLKVAGTITSRVRRSDTVVRYGGEEIAVILEDTLIENAVQVAEHARKMVERLTFEHGDERFSVTVSAGVAAFMAGDGALRNALDQADQALYRAKNAGRNRVESLMQAAA
ncbi:GGDEF domain-containing protein [Martelella alba]|uniref:GGDEF domain-containing protein n=1 Tax=Martelella alba TaxID=2590451 RepID=UPI0015E87403|nr:diguanylate cyclase [Martelella alba]